MRYRDPSPRHSEAHPWEIEEKKGSRTEADGSDGIWDRTEGSEGRLTRGRMRPSPAPGRTGDRLPKRSDSLSTAKEALPRGTNRYRISMEKTRVNRIIRVDAE